MDATFSDLTARLGATRTISADDVLVLRRSVYGADAVTREEAEVLIALDAISGKPAWSVQTFDPAMAGYIRMAGGTHSYTSDRFR